MEGLLVRTFKGKDAVLMSEIIEKAALVDDPENYFYNFLATDDYSLEMALINNPVYGTGLPPWQDLQKGYLYQTGSASYGLMVGWEPDTIGGRIHNAYDVRLMDGGTIEVRTKDITYPDNG